MSFPFNPDVYWAGGEKRITLRDAYILMRFFKRLDEIVMREWDRDNDNAIAICRLMGGLEYEIFSEVTTEHALKRREQEESADTVGSIEDRSEEGVSPEEVTV